MLILGEHIQGDGAAFGFIPGHLWVPGKDWKGMKIGQSSNSGSMLPHNKNCSSPGVFQGLVSQRAFDLAWT